MQRLAMISAPSRINVDGRTPNTVPLPPRSPPGSDMILVEAKPLRAHFLEPDEVMRGGHQGRVASVCDKRDSFVCADAVDDSR